MENFGKFMIVILAMITSPIISGFVIVKLWAWFIVSTFEMQPLRLVEAIGIMLLINFIKATRNKTDEKGFWEEFATNIFFVILMALFALLSGWIVSLFM